MKAVTVVIEYFATDGLSIEYKNMKFRNFIEKCSINIADS